MPRHDSSSESEDERKSKGSSGMRGDDRDGRKRSASPMRDDRGSRGGGERRRSRSRERDRSRERERPRSRERERSRERRRSRSRERDRSRERRRSRSRERERIKEREKIKGREDMKRSRSPSSSSSSDDSARGGSKKDKKERKKERKREKKERKREKKEKKREKKAGKERGGSAVSASSGSGTTFEERMQSLRAMADKPPEDRSLQQHRQVPPRPPPPAAAQNDGRTAPPAHPETTTTTTMRSSKAEGGAPSSASAPASAQAAAEDKAREEHRKAMQVATHKGLGEAPKPVAAHGAAMTLEQWRAMANSRPELAAVSKGLNASNEESIKPKEDKEGDGKDAAGKSDSSKDWECHARHCNGHINFRKAEKCSKCGAYRRMGQGSYRPQKETPAAPSRSKNLMF